MPLPPHKMARVIVNTDARNEADDQYCIVQALLTPSFELHGVVPAHFGTAKSPHSMRDSHDEVMKLLDLMDLTGQVTVADGAENAIPDPETPSPSPGAELIVREAMKDDDRPLHVAFLGPLTDMASALLMEPQIAERNVRVIWIGGGEWPVGGWEYNLSNDIAAANVVFRSSLVVWQIPMPVYRMIGVGYAELMERVAPHGAIGRYLVDQLIAWNAASHSGPIEFRSLGDTPALSVIMNPFGGRSDWRPAPQFTAAMQYVHPGLYRPIRVYETIDVRFILEDFFAKLARFARGEQETALFR
ncbi:nucleoside hydrolase [Bauldia sp.]|uniref:nucleoside hydrolase n=1 Tax=Bauldia sp. TaxID=2575872 RepID=UPI003BAB8739